MDTAQPPLLPTPGSRRLAVFFKIISIFLLIAALHIPLGMTHGVLRERQGYQQQVVREIAETWGQAQQVTGPVLLVPWTQTRERTVRKRVADDKYADEKETYLVSGFAYFLPDKLEVTGQLDPEVRYRGIFESVVYAANLRLAGTFRPVAADTGLLPATFHWERARVFLGCSDLRRLRSAPTLTVEGTSAAFEPAGKKEVGDLGMAVAIPGLGEGVEKTFVIGLDLQGSERLEVAPVGRQTTVSLTSSWANPSFTGAQLPVQREVGPAGFTAQWKVGPYGRNYPWVWSTSSGVNTAEIVTRLSEGCVGAMLIQPVDGYRLAERAQKYGVLFFVLVFAVFFLFEVTAPGLRIHPLQYALVGAALALFFLGFLALSEFLATGVAYGASAAVCTALVVLYAWSFLKTGWRTLVIGGGLAATYGYLYFVLQSQDYALVAGTVALFAALALVMFCTRRINWYALDTKLEARP